MHSIYHFFVHLVKNKSLFQTKDPLSRFPFAAEMLACRNDGQRAASVAVLRETCGTLIYFPHKNS